jgi:hypothetical protein
MISIHEKLLVYILFSEFIRHIFIYNHYLRQNALLLLIFSFMHLYILKL